MSNISDNRRSSYRLNRAPDHPWQVNIDDTLITKNIINLSSTGISFKAPSSFNMEPGQTLNLTLSFKPGESFDCKGRILWSRSDSPTVHTMKLFGVEFEKLPAWLDSRITQELNSEALKAHTRNNISSSGIARPQDVQFSRTWTSLLSQIFTVGLIAAFLMLAHLYTKTHPEDSIEYRFNQSLAKKLKHF